MLSCPVQAALHQEESVHDPFCMVGADGAVAVLEEKVLGHLPLLNFPPTQASADFPFLPLC